MTSPEDATAAAPAETQEETSAAVTEEPPSGVVENCDEADAGSSPVEDEEEEEPEKTLALADELFEKGSQAIRDEDFVVAVDCLSRALEIRTAHYGELASECAMSYYKYGCALLYKAQEEADPLGDVIKAPQNSVASSSSAIVANGSAKASANESNGNDKKEETGDDGSDDDEDAPEADEEDSDLDLSWKMLDIARAIAERQSEDSMDKVNIYSALGEVALEREDFESSLNDYCKALSILENLVEPDHRRIIELNFRICLTLEVDSKVQEAIPYCEKATQLCGLRLQRLSEEMKLKSSLPSSSIVDDRQPLSDNSAQEEEIKAMSEFQSDLQKKLEDLKQGVDDHRTMISDMLKLASGAAVHEEKKFPISAVGSEPSNSSQVGATHPFESPTMSTSAANASVTHLGVIGRGVKRASTVPIALEASSKKSQVESTTNITLETHNSVDQVAKSTE